MIGIENPSLIDVIFVILFVCAIPFAAWRGWKDAGKDAIPDKKMAVWKERQ